MKSHRSFRRCCGLMVFGFALTGLAYSAESVVPTADVNRDGAPDRWSTPLADGATLKIEDRDYDGVPDTWIDDRMSTAVRDQNRDGVIDQLFITRKDAEATTSLNKVWFDTDFDGEFDSLRIYEADKENLRPCEEYWSKRPDGSSVSYKKVDRRASTITMAKTTSLGSRELTDVVVRPIVKKTGIERLEFGGWVDYDAGLRVSKDRRGRTTAIQSWDEDGDILLSAFRRGKSDPGAVRIRQWDPTTPEPHQTKAVIALSDQITTGHFRSYSFESNGTETCIKFNAFDRNRDGTYDRFRETLSDGSERSGEDQDFDGRLDRVAVQSADGTTFTLQGDRIPDRNIPTLPVAIPEQRIQALLRQADSNPN